MVSNVTTIKDEEFESRFDLGSLQYPCVDGVDTLKGIASTSQAGGVGFNPRPVPFSCLENSS